MGERMTVKELKALLATMPDNHTVVRDLHSAYAKVTAVALITGYDNGGYIATARTPEQKLREHGYVYVG